MCFGHSGHRIHLSERVHGIGSSPDYADSDGNEWADINGSTGLSWDDIAVVCPQDGVTPCAGTLNGNDATGWIWATLDQARALFRGITGLTTELDDYRVFVTGVAVPTAWGQPIVDNLTPTFVDTNFYQLQAWTATERIATPGVAFQSHYARYIAGSSSFEQIVLNNPNVTSRSARDQGAFLFRPASPEVLIGKLVDLVIQLNLQSGIANSLDSKLDTVLRALEDLNANNDIAAINALYAFMNAVEAQRGNKISDADADALIAAAQAIIDLLENP